MDTVQSVWTSTKGWFNNNNNNNNNNNTDITNHTNIASFDQNTNEIARANENVNNQLEDEKPIYYKDLHECLEPGT